MPLSHRSPVSQGTYEFEGNQRSLSVLFYLVGPQKLRTCAHVQALHVMSEQCPSVMSLLMTHLKRHKKSLMALLRLYAAAASMTFIESPKRPL